MNKKQELLQAKKDALEKIKNEIIEKAFAKINDLLANDEISDSDLKTIFKVAVDMSGCKKDELQPTQYIININNKAVDVERD